MSSMATTLDEALLDLSEEEKMELAMTSSAAEAKVAEIVVNAEEASGDGTDDDSAVRPVLEMVVVW